MGTPGSLASELIVDVTISEITDNQSERFISNNAQQWAESDFEMIFLQYYPRVVAILNRVVGERTSAEELANDVFWRLYQNPSLAAPDNNLGGWLYRTAVCLGIDRMRASARRKQYEQAAGQNIIEHQVSASPLDEVFRDEQRRRVQATLARLKPIQAQLLILRNSGLSYKELALTLDIKPSSIGTLLARAEADFERLYCQTYPVKE